MSGWSEVFLGIIAFATLTIAIGLVGVLIAAGQLARRISRLADQIELEVKPLFAHLNAIGRDASHAAALATAQVERVDRLFTDLTERLGRTLTAVQDTLGGPAREGSSILGALLAAVRAVRNGKGRARGDEEDALFI